MTTLDSGGTLYTDETDLYAKSILFINPGKLIVMNRVEVWEDGAQEDLETTDTSIQGWNNKVYANTISQYIDESGKKRLNDIVFKGINCHSNMFGSNCRSNTFGHTCCYNILGVENYQNIFGDKCSSNRFGDYCSANKFGNTCNTNKWGSTCSMNTVGNSFNNNTFGAECRGIMFGNTCSNNSLGNACTQIAGGNKIQFCRLGNSIINTFFGDLRQDEQGNIHYDELESGFQFIKIGNSIMSVKLKCVASRDPLSQSVRYITIGDGIQNKTIEINDFNQTHHTKYQLAGEETISI